MLNSEKCFKFSLSKRGEDQYKEIVVALISSINEIGGVCSLLSLIVKLEGEQDEHERERLKTKDSNSCTVQYRVPKATMLVQ